MLFGSFADYLSHAYMTDWLACIVIQSRVLQTRVGPVKKFKKIAYYIIIEIESLTK